MIGACRIETSQRQVLEFDSEEAKRCLLLHGSGCYDSEGESVALADGFLGYLRPYIGLREENFHQVMEALLVVGEQLYSSPKVDRELLESLWSMCYLARAWCLASDGMLQRNNLIEEQDVKLLETWVKCVEGTALSLLNGCPPHYQARAHAQYIFDFGPGENIEYFVGLICQALSDEDLSDPALFAQALGKLGAKAQTSLTYLQKALLRDYKTYSITGVHKEEIRAALQEAIEQIEHSISSSQ